MKRSDLYTNTALIKHLKAHADSYIAGLEIENGVDEAYLEAHAHVEISRWNSLEGLDSRIRRAILTGSDRQEVLDKFEHAVVYHIDGTLKDMAEGKRNEPVPVEREAVFA